MKKLLLSLIVAAGLLGTPVVAQADGFSFSFSYQGGYPKYYKYHKHHHYGYYGYSRGHYNHYRPYHSYRYHRYYYHHWPHYGFYYYSGPRYYRHCW